MYTTRFMMIEIELTETVERTDAVAVTSIRGARFAGSGQARRSPADPNVPVIGEELAAARALTDLAVQLEAAAERGLAQRVHGHYHATL